MLLVFDDSQGFSRSLTAALERAIGARVLRVESRSALDDVLESGQPIAAALIDASMPHARTTVLELATELTHARPGISIAVMTYALSDDLTELFTEHGLIQFDKVGASKAMTTWASFALRASHAQRAWMLHALARRARQWKLSPAEIDVIRRALEGDPAIKSIARARGSRTATVSTQVAKILERSGAPTLRRLLAGLYVYALKLATEHAARNFPDLAVPPPPDLSARSPRPRRPSRRAPREEG